MNLVVASNIGQVNLESLIGLWLDLTRSEVEPYGAAGHMFDPVMPIQG